MSFKQAIGIVIAAIAAAGVWYFASPYPRATSEAGALDSSTAALGVQSFSDDPKAIETDLQATDLSNLDRELKAIDAELGP